MFSLQALTLLVTAASLAQAHSLDKRETTVSKCWQPRIDQDITIWV